MKIHHKIIAIVVSIFLLAFIVNLGLSYYTIKTQGNKRKASHREIETMKIKRNLRNYVNIAYSMVANTYYDYTRRDYLRKRYGPQLREVLDEVHAILRSHARQARAGSLSPAEARRRAKALIAKIKYNEMEHIWICDTGLPYPTMVMHPGFPQLEGKKLEHPKYMSTIGTRENLFSKAVQLVSQEGESFLDYTWPRRDKKGLMPEVPQFAYVRLFEPWGWVYGTGVHMHHAVLEAQEKSKKDLEKMRYDMGTGYFWINDTGKPFPRMIMHPINKELVGKVLDDEKFNCAYDNKTNLFVAFVRVCLKSHRGFVPYKWDKPIVRGGKETTRKNMDKLSYVRLFKPYGWIIGSGVYVDDMREEMEELDRTLEQEEKMLLYKIFSISGLILLVGLIVMFFVLKEHLRSARLIPKLPETKGSE